MEKKRKEKDAVIGYVFILDIGIGVPVNINKTYKYFIDD